MDEIPASGEAPATLDVIMWIRLSKFATVLLTISHPFPIRTTHLFTLALTCSRFDARRLVKLENKASHLHFHALAVTTHASLTELASDTSSTAQVKYHNFPSLPINPLSLLSASVKVVVDQ